MKELTLSQNQVAIVDDADYEHLNQWKWTLQARANGSRYAYRKEGSRNVYLHRQLLSAPTGTDVDHINSNGLDNRRSNLRLATRSQNSRNTRLRSDSSSGYKGVAWHKEKKKWRAHINFDKKQKHLGYFMDIHDAVSAYNTAAKTMFGEFARPNGVS